MKLVTISGLDGSGKSTQIKLLKKYLESRGKRVFYFHAVDFSIGNRIANFFTFHRNNNYHPLSSGGGLGVRVRMKTRKFTNKPKSVTHANRLQIQLRKIALRVDIWRFKKLVKKLEKQGYDYILSDRFFYDTIINISCLEDKSSKLPARGWSALGGKITSSIAIYLQADPQNIMSRDRVPDQGLEYLEKKEELYDAKTKIWNWKIIDGNRSKEEIFEEIKIA